ncbi:MAG: PASTA domain-containing protein [Acidobacteria bacterium]|nr:PASTA domain-containing protein [Acidobacteriota bacterium]MBS1866617.1 PASTA domain-containing protein [Acidobacteriota bacterium]
MSDELQPDEASESRDDEPRQQPFVEGLKERLEWAARMSLLVFILAAAAFLSAITAMRIAIHGREVNMPNLVGKNVSEAGKMLQSAGLGLRVADHVYSDLPINVVVRQTPPPGMQMKVEQQAHVVLSLGQRQLQIPAIEGDSLRVSRIELLRGGLQVGEVSNLPMADQPVDTVVMQNPKPGAGGATPRVDVLVSAGPREASYVMPHLVGLNEEEAQRRLEASGIKRKVNGVSAPQWPHGTVIDQSPMAGARLSAATQVELTTAD